ncbi:Potassium channel [Physocladia obscura]|uniref:Potassium channel n=1 Tax=Physocladia obscura TaxID=109957 RepID=A0AAD5XHB6_9FUNG|nr:Potassium channel [Physocladia obscura]
MAMLVPVAMLLNVQSLAMAMTAEDVLATTLTATPSGMITAIPTVLPAIVFELSPAFIQTTLTQIALFCGFVASVADLLRMIEKKIKWSTRVIIFGAFCQVAVYWTREKVPPFTSDGIFLTFASAVTSLLASYIGYSELERNSRQHQAYVYTMNSLSPDQRQLTILSIFSFTFIVIGGSIYSFLEDWDLNESMYFAVVVSTSIGFGDLSPQTILGKLLLFIFAPIGLGAVGLNIYAVRQTLLEFFTLRLADAFSERFGMHQEHQINSISDSSEADDSNYILPRSTSFDMSTSSSSQMSFQSQHRHSSSSSSNSPPKLLNRSVRGSEAPLLSPALSYSRQTSRPARRMTLARVGSTFPQLTLLGDHQIRRKMVVSATKDVFRLQINQALALDGIYFTFITLTTIGFGDFSPKTPLTRSLFIWFVFVGIASVTYLGSMLSERILNQWTVTVGLIEDRVGRYEVKARIKRDWGSSNASNSSSALLTDTAACATTPNGTSSQADRQQPIAILPRIVRITSPLHEHNSVPTRLNHSRSLGFLADRFVGNYEESDGGSSTEEETDLPLPEENPATPFLKAPESSPARLEERTRSISSSIRVFSVKSGRREGKSGSSETDSLLGSRN